jgi:phage terminase large subunit GpA-like protein
VSEAGPGYIHLDATTDEVAVEQITSETMVYRMVQGRKVRMWKPRASGARNEQLDTFVYAYAAMVGRGGAAIVDRRESFQVEQPLLEVPEPKIEPIVQQLHARRAPPRRQSWATGWKR